MEQTEMERTSDYDKDLRMFVEPPRSVNRTSLRFLRCPVENGRLGCGPAGRSSGEFVELSTGAAPVAEAV
jgi:hypothetical protein